jgi:hypothetical protein
MDTKKNIKDLEKSLVRDLGKMTKLLDAHFATMPEEAIKMMAPMRADMTKVLKSIKDGDVDAINSIKDKYGNLNR